MEWQSPAGIQADIGTRSVLRIDRDRRQLIVVRVAFVLQIHDHLQLAVGGLSRRSGVVELRGEVDAADGVVKARDLEVVRGRIERQRAFGTRGHAVDQVRPHLRVRHRREEGQVEAEHFNEHGDQHADNKAGEALDRADVGASRAGEAHVAGFGR